MPAPPQTIRNIPPQVVPSQASVSIHGVDNTTNIPQPSYERTEDASLPQSPTYSSMNVGEPFESLTINDGEPYPSINFLEKQFSIDKHALRKYFYSEENKPKKIWFLAKFKGNNRQSVQDKF